MGGATTVAVCGSAVVDVSINSRGTIGDEVLTGLHVASGGVMGGGRGGVIDVIV